MRFLIKGRCLKTTHIWFETQCTPESLEKTKKTDAFVRIQTGNFEGITLRNFAQQR